MIDVNIIEKHNGIDGGKLAECTHMQRLIKRNETVILLAADIYTMFTTVKSYQQ